MKPIEINFKTNIKSVLAALFLRMMKNVIKIEFD